MLINLRFFDAERKCPRPVLAVEPADHDVIPLPPRRLFNSRPRVDGTDVGSGPNVIRKLTYSGGRSEPTAAQEWCL